MFNKINNTNIFLIALVTYFALLINPVKSEYPTTSIGVIDINMILSEAKAAIKVSEEIEEIAINIEDEMKKIEDELILEQNELAESQAVMTPESFESKMQNFQTKVQNFNITKQEKLVSLDNMVAEARLQVLNAMEPILEEITIDEGITILLDKSIVLLNNEKMDITDKVLKRLNKELSSIKISKD